MLHVNAASGAVVQCEHYVPPGEGEGEGHVLLWTGSPSEETNFT